MLNEAEVQTLLMAYIIHSMQSDRVDIVKGIDFVTKKAADYNMHKDDILSAILEGALYAKDEARVLSVVNLFKLKMVDIAKDIHQVLFLYYSAGNTKNETKLSKAIQEYETQYGNDEHLMIAKLNLSMMNQDYDAISASFDRIQMIVEG